MRLPRLLIGLCAITALAGCGKRQTPVETGVRTQTLHVGNSAEPADLDPHYANAYTDYNILIALFEGLTVLDEASSKPLPGAAESWEISEDGLTYTFRLRDGLVWSNGEPVTAEDFAFSIQRMLTPSLGSPYTNLLDSVRGALAFSSAKTTDFSTVGVEVVDPRTLRINLEKPTPYFLSILAHQALFPVSKKVVLSHGAAAQRGTGWSKPENIVGNGAFVLDEWSRDRHLAVKKNPRYWDTANNRLERVVFYPISSQKVEEANFRTGQLHITYEVLPDRIDTFKRERPDEIRIDPLLETYFLRFNVTRAPFTDKRVRQALSLAIDRDGISNAVMRGSRIPAHFLTPPNTAGYTSEAKVETDYEEARRLLADAGFPGGKGFPRVELQMNADSINTPILEAIQQTWRRELGIDVALTQYDFGVYLANQQNLAYDISRSRWVGDYNDPSTFTDLFLSHSGNNQTGWKNEAYDSLLDRASREMNPERRFDLLQQAEAVLLEDAPIAPVFFGTRTFLISRHVKGWVPSLLGIHRYQTVRLE